MSSGELGRTTVGGRIRPPDANPERPFAYTTALGQIAQGAYGRSASTVCTRPWLAIVSR